MALLLSSAVAYFFFCGDDGNWQTISCVTKYTKSLDATTEDRCIYKWKRKQTIKAAFCAVDVVWCVYCACHLTAVQQSSNVVVELYNGMHANIQTHFLLALFIQIFIDEWWGQSDVHVVNRLCEWWRLFKACSTILNSPYYRVVSKAIWFEFLSAKEKPKKKTKPKNNLHALFPAEIGAVEINRRQREKTFLPPHLYSFFTSFLPYPLLDSKMNKSKDFF